VLSNSDFLNGMVMREAIEVVIDKLEELGIGKRKVNYKIRDAAFSRQRYWGEPFPIKWINGIAYPLDESELPLELPHVEKYGPGPEGEGPLANIPAWKNKKVKLDLSESPQTLPTGEDLDGVLETNTMPGYAGSSWYFLRYMDPHNSQTFCDKKISAYWNQVDLYVGGTEHAVGHLLYSRMWTKCLYDLGLITFDEPFKRLLNQGMIQGSSRFINRVQLNKKDESEETTLSTKYVSKDKALSIIEKFEGLNAKGVFKVWMTEVFPDINVQTYEGLSIKNSSLHTNVNIVDGDVLDIAEFRKWRPEYVDAVMITEDDGRFICSSAVEKMSKRLYNTVNPDDLVQKYGADTFRMYEMFLGPVEMSKPWDTKGIEGVHRFLKKLWRLFFDEQKGKLVTEEKASPEELKVLHRTIKKIQEDTERFSYNTAVSAFMVCVNELTDLKCHKKEVLEPILILLAPYAPHIAEELYHQLGNANTVVDAAFPTFDPQYLVETSKEYPVSINGKLRTQIVLDLDASQEQVQEIALANPVVQKWMEGKPLKKFIFVKGKMVNIVV
jgi:leucyl-tRNA synthetase